MYRRLKKRLFDITGKTKQIKKKSERKISERKGKRRDAPYCFSLLTEEIVELYEHRSKVLTT